MHTKLQDTSVHSTGIGMQSLRCGVTYVLCRGAHCTSTLRTAERQGTVLSITVNMYGIHIFTFITVTTLFLNFSLYKSPFKDGDLSLKHVGEFRCKDDLRFCINFVHLLVCMGDYSLYEGRTESHEQQFFVK